MNLLDFVILLVTLIITFAVYTLTLGKERHTKHSDSLPVSLSSQSIITITANDILLDSNFVLNPITRKLLWSLSQRACVYVIVVVGNMNQMRVIRSSIIDEFKNVVNEDCILFCQTALGRSSMVRQLEPIVHLDYDPQVVHQVSIFHRAVLIADSQVSSPHALCQCSSFVGFMETQLQRLFPILG
jgi:hypothetical protein